MADYSSLGGRWNLFLMFFWRGVEGEKGGGGGLVFVGANWE